MNSARLARYTVAAARMCGLRQSFARAAAEVASDIVVTESLGRRSSIAPRVMNPTSEMTPIARPTPSPKRVSVAPTTKSATATAATDRCPRRDAGCGGSSTAARPRRSGRGGRARRAARATARGRRGPRRSRSAAPRAWRGRAAASSTVSPGRRSGLWAMPHPATIAATASGGRDARGLVAPGAHERQGRQSRGRRNAAPRRARPRSSGRRRAGGRPARSTTRPAMRQRARHHARCQRARSERPRQVVLARAGGVAGEVDSGQIAGGRDGERRRSGSRSGSASS